MSWKESYIGKLRNFVGHQKLIVPSIRAIIEDRKGNILFIERKGEGRWSMPAGSIELDESIFECLVREVKEETGLEVVYAKVIAIYSNPKYGQKNKFGDEYQLFEFLFLVDTWKGSLIKCTEETIDANFFNLDEIPQSTNEFWTLFHKEIIEDYKHFKKNERLILK